jgi:hypothetical protein
MLPAVAYYVLFCYGIWTPDGSVGQCKWCCGRMFFVQTTTGAHRSLETDMASLYSGYIYWISRESFRLTGSGIYPGKKQKLLRQETGPAVSR